VDHRARFSTLNASYEDFLFAPVCEDANGMRLSVISALARTNVDPWEEATRLAAMPKAIAEKTLLSILDLVSGRSWKSPEAAAIAARLVRLLPQSGEAAPMAAAGTVNAAPGIAKVLNLQNNYWWLWVAMALAMSFMTPHHQAGTSSAPAVASESGATSQSTSSTEAPDSRSVPIVLPFVSAFGVCLQHRRISIMPAHMPPVPPASRHGEKKSPNDKLGKHEHHANAAEKGETANIKQNTTNKGFFRGRRLG
jgi:hypothetical protein